MIVQSMVIFYGSAQAFNISLDRTWARHLYRIHQYRSLYE